MTTALEVFKAYDSALSSGDYAALFELFAEDIVWYQPGTHQFAGVFEGLEAVQNHLASLASNVDVMSFKTEDVFADDTTVAAVVNFAASRSGRQIDMREVDVFKIVDGKIQEVRLIDKDVELENAFWA